MRIFTSLFFLMLLLTASFVHAQNDVSVRKALFERIKTAWQNSDFATLEAMENTYLDPSQRTPSGKRLLEVFDGYLAGLITITPEDEHLPPGPASESLIRQEMQNGPPPSRYNIVNQACDHLEKKINKWEQAFPDSANPKIAKAIYYTNRGYYFRGMRFTSQVHREAWPILQENYDEAQMVLVDTQTISRKNPIWFERMLDILGVQSPPRDKIDSLIADTLEHGQGYPGAMHAAFLFMQPRWGGSYQKMEDFARYANKKTMATEHGILYAVLYWRLVFKTRDEMNQEFFTRTRASWPMMEQSFKILVHRYPDPRNFRGYALFACMAGETAKAKQLLEKAYTPAILKEWTPSLVSKCIGT